LLANEQADIIIAPSSLTTYEQASLEQNATVLYLPETLNWKKQFYYLADKLGESWQAADWLSSYHKKVMETNERLHNLQIQKTAIVLRMTNQHVYDESRNPLFSILYHDLTFSLPDQHHPVGKALTIDNIANLQADVIF